MSTRRSAIIIGMLASTFWPLGIGIWLAVLVFAAGLILIAAIFILLLPFAATAGIQDGVRSYYYAERAQWSAQSRARSRFSLKRSE
jgi:hypothetical protein